MEQFLEYLTWQNITVAFTSLFGAGGIIFGVRERRLANKAKELANENAKINNVDLIQKIYGELLHHLKQHLEFFRDAKSE